MLNVLAIIGITIISVVVAVIMFMSGIGSLSLLALLMGGTFILLATLGE